MSERSRYASRFDANGDDDPFGSFGNLIDVMLVFACGLIAALTNSGLELRTDPGSGQTVEQGRELPELPEGVGKGRGGYESVGTVYRDPETGRLLLVGQGEAVSDE